MKAGWYGCCLLLITFIDYHHSDTNNKTGYNNVSTIICDVQTTTGENGLCCQNVNNGYEQFQF